jgi:hypothetical protein
MMPTDNINYYKLTSVQYYLLEDTRQEEGWFMDYYYVKAVVIYGTEM